MKKKETKNEAAGTSTTKDQSYFEALFGPENLRGTIILSIYALSFQWIGCNIINIFSNRIVTDVNRYLPDSKKVLANTATQLFGYLGLVTSCLGAFLLSTFGRRTMTITGFSLISCMHFMICLSITVGDGRMVVVFMLMLRMCL